MYMKIQLLNETSGERKDLKVGFSWTYLFFTLFVSLFRKDWKWLGIALLVAFLSSVVDMIFVNWVYSLVMAFFYNKIYAKELVEKGYKGATEQENKTLTEYIQG